MSICNGDRPQKWEKSKNTVTVLDSEIHPRAGKSKEREKVLIAFGSRRSNVIQTPPQHRNKHSSPVNNRVTDGADDPNLDNENIQIIGERIGGIITQEDLDFLDKFINFMRGNQSVSRRDPLFSPVSSTRMIENLRSPQETPHYNPPELSSDDNREHSEPGRLLGDTSENNWIFPINNLGKPTGKSRPVYQASYPNVVSGNSQNINTGRSNRTLSSNTHYVSHHHGLRFEDDEEQVSLPHRSDRNRRNQFAKHPHWNDKQSRNDYADSTDTGNPTHFRSRPENPFSSTRTEVNRSYYTTNLIKIIDSSKISFSGIHDEDLNDYLFQMDELKRWIGASDGDILNVLSGSLKGYALDWYRSHYTQWPTWNIAKEAFRERFAGKKYQQTLRQDIEYRCQGENESLREYLTAMRNLMERTNPRCPVDDQIMIAIRNMLPRPNLMI